MERSGLLKQIWGGALTVSHVKDASSLEALLTSLVNVPVVSLVSDEPMPRPVAYMESAELMADVSIGDILAEELEIEVPYGAMVLVQPKTFEENRELAPADLGEVLGRVLLDVAHHTAPVKGGSKDVSKLGLSAPVVALSDFAESTAGRLQ